jgi:hypothetical protein
MALVYNRLCCLLSAVQRAGAYCGEKVEHARVPENSRELEAVACLSGKAVWMGSYSTVIVPP